MAEPTAAELQTAAKLAAKEILEGGVASFTHGDRSQTMLNPREVLDLARHAQALEDEETFGQTTRADMRGAG